VAVGDVLVGYASDSIHANGWSLVRRVLREFPGEVTDDELAAWLKPTRLYHDVTRDLKKSGVKPKAMSHITGGGLPENLERLFRGMGADLEIPRWELPGIDKLLAHVDAQDRFHTFNMGIGWVAIVAEADVEAALKAGPGGRVIGRMVPKRASGLRIRRVMTNPASMSDFLKHECGIAAVRLRKPLAYYTTATAPACGDSTSCSCSWKSSTTAARTAPASAA
jgi:phosphoribosylformylglycinamidine cyclo-ligase